MAANIRSGIALVKVITALQATNTIACGVVLRAASNAKGMLSNTAIAVPISAIHRVSIVALTMADSW
jgi:hypothetical protein